MISILTDIMPSLTRAALALLLAAATLSVKADVFEYKDDAGLYYLCDENTMEAVVIACRNAGEGYIYTQGTLTIPATVAVSGSSLGSGGGSQSQQVYKVTEISEAALKDSWVQILSFAADSHVRVIRRQGLYGIKCTGTLTLPASLRVIEEEGLYVKSKETSLSFISTLILPASLDSLGKSAIVLNKLQTLQFLGTTPPKCHYTESSNPWMAEENATPDNITVTYPEGAYAAYNNCYGIGNYFTSFTGPETPTGIDEMQEEDGATTMKVMRNGQGLIVRDGRFYTMLGQLIIDN